MNSRTLSLLFVLCFSSAHLAIAQSEAPSAKQRPKPLRALLIAGGCCHDYARQQEAIRKGIQERAHVQVDVYWTDNTTTTPVLPLYRKLNWAEDYDVIIHDECAADIKDVAMVNRILQVHQEIPAVHLHCAMHSFRTGTDAWFQHLGLQSSGHGPQLPIDIEFVGEGHPITAKLENWTTIREELYNNVKLYGAVPLAIGKQRRGSGANEKIDEAIVAWINESSGARSFSTTIGHNTETIEDPRYLDLITRGLLWACGKLNDDYLQPYEPSGTVTFIDKTKVASAAEPMLEARPANSTLVHMEASSTQEGHPPQHAIDGQTDTRWCAADGSYPQSLTFQFEQPVQVESIQLIWEMQRPYRYRIEGSTDGKSWDVLVDHSQTRQHHPEALTLPSPRSLTHVRIAGVGASPGSWFSLCEVQFKGPGLEKLWPATIDAKTQKWTAGDTQNGYEKRGNVPPSIERLTADQEAAILRDVRVPDGFEATLFAAPPAVNYPVFVAASVDGTLYVSSDGNGSLGRQEERGRVIRLRDLDGDGRADETKVFCEVDAPRGLVWDHDRLYLMHPPHLSVFIDQDRDGVADIQKTLVKNLAFGYDQRPADHTTNGLSLGADGWLYIAGGDFGFLKAQGSDGKVLTHRGGGVIRVRPDGTDLQLYSTGTRNILEVAISPQMELFARDNTNDGGGWDVRLHHFTGNDDHGYPRLYRNFNDECVQPLADYGGGSGCGAVYIDEPGLGDWNHAPFTADWGTGALYRHTVTPRGATYQETAPPKPFIQMTRPTDADVDGNSRVYCASWKGASFDWAGPNVGYVVCVRPKGYQPSSMPNFEKASDADLIRLLKDPSYRRRMEAQRTLLRRGNAAHTLLLTQSLAERNAEREMLAAMQDWDGAEAIKLCLRGLSHGDPVIVHTAVRELARREAVAACFDALDHQKAPSSGLLRALAMMHRSDVVDGLIDRASKAPTPLRHEILHALCRLYHREGEWKGDSWGTRPDTRGPYYQPVTWKESERIAQVLEQALDAASPYHAASLLQMMVKNRIEREDALQRMMAMAEKDQKLLPAVLQQLSNTAKIPESALGLVRKAVAEGPAEIIDANLVRVVSKIDSAEGVTMLVRAMERLDQSSEEGVLRLALRSFTSAPSLQNQASLLVSKSQLAEGGGLWWDAALLAVAGQNQASPEAKQSATSEIARAWAQPQRRMRWMQAALKIGSHHLDRSILEARKDSDGSIAKQANEVVRLLKIRETTTQDSPLVKTMSVPDALAAILKAKGDLEIGKQVFVRANCGQCHSLTKEEVQKGPYLGTIAKTYERPALAEALLDPSKTIAQGFSTNLFVMSDGRVLTGFVTDEKSDQVSFRDKDGKETTLSKDDIEERKTSKISVMPDGVLNEFSLVEVASLLDYLQSLAVSQ
ncbi:MAG: discoidin domain-containing protein [Pirellulales bacterium]